MHHIDSKKPYNRIYIFQELIFVLYREVVACLLGWLVLGKPIKIQAIIYAHASIFIHTLTHTILTHRRWKESIRTHKYTHITTTDLCFYKFVMPLNVAKWAIGFKWKWHFQCQVHSLDNYKHICRNPYYSWSGIN